MKLNLPLKIIAGFLFVLFEIVSFILVSMAPKFSLMKYITDSVVILISILFIIYMLHFIFFAGNSSKDVTPENKNDQRPQSRYRFIGITMLIVYYHLGAFFTMSHAGFLTYYDVDILYLLYAIYHFYPKKDY